MTTKKKVGISLLALLCAGVVTASTVGISEHIKNSNSSTYTSIAAETNNVVINTADNNGISLTAVTLSNELTANATYESSYSITATLDNEYAIDKTITWSLSCDSGDDPSDYVFLSSSSSESGEAITVYCTTAFSNQITLTATNGSISNKCTIDYVARITGVTAVYDNYAMYDDFKGQIDWYTYTICSIDSLSTWASGDYMVNGVLSHDEYSEGTVLLNLTYGIGSVKDTAPIDDFDTDTVFSAEVTFADDVKSELETALGISDASYDISDYFGNGGLFSTNAIFNGFFGSSVMSQDSYKAKVYNALIDYYNAGTAIFKITISTTGELSGINYSFDCYAKCNPSAYYVSAANVALSSTSIYF